MIRLNNNFLFKKLLSKKMQLPAKSSLSELGHYLQPHTKQHLYIENNSLISVNEPEQMIGKYRYHSSEYEDLPVYGLRLQNCDTGSIIEVFSDSLVEHLLSDRFDEAESPCNDPVYLSSSSEISDSSESSSLGRYETAYFRMFLKYTGNFDEDSIYVNSKTIKQIETENQIDLYKTITDSFVQYLDYRGYLNSAIRIEFYENVFGEVVIETKLPLSQEILINIEKEAYLNLNQDTLHFKLRHLKTKYDTGEDLYSEQIDFSNLPNRLQLSVLDRLELIPNQGDKTLFIYDYSQFKIKNEGDGLYSVFDLDLYLSNLHLDPFFYPEARSYSELPVAQFYL